ncbi:MAG: serine hydrolase [Gemmatimonadota bacterium]
MRRIPVTFLARPDLHGRRGSIAARCAGGSRPAAARTLALLGALAAVAACGGPPSPGAPAPGAELAPPVPADLGALEATLRARLAPLAPEEEVMVAVLDLETERALGIDATVPAHAASTMKVPVLLELYRRAALGQVDLDAPVEVRTTFRSILDGSLYTLSADADSDAELYERVGGTTTLRELGRRMIVRSSNLATNLLIDILDADSVQAMLAELGVAPEDLLVLRGVEDGPAYQAGLSNMATAWGLARTLEAAASCEVVPEPLCGEVVQVLAEQEFAEMIPRGVPAGTRVAHKTGWITGIRHDAAVVYPAGSPPYVLVVLTRGFAEPARADSVGAAISADVWAALGPDGRLRLRAERGPAAALLPLHREVRVPAFFARALRYDEYWNVVGPLVDDAALLTRDSVGVSAEGRTLYAVRFGTGPSKVLMWSQMHGDETTATRALADLYSLIATRPDDPRVRRWAEALTLVNIPMLNPDGAERYQRRNAHNVDVNRDARELATPEAQTLKRVREALEPHYGFNLHDQNPRSRVGRTDRGAGIALLAPRPHAGDDDPPGLVRGQRLAVDIGRAIEPLVGGHITRYDDTFTPRAFGDLMQAWGASTVLIESGGWADAYPKDWLRAVNFVALAHALDVLAAGEPTGDAAWYHALPPNGRTVRDLLVMGGTVVRSGLPPARLDLALDVAPAGEGSVWRLEDTGDLAGVEARDTLDAAGLFVHFPTGVPGDPAISSGPLPALTLRRSAEPGAEVIGTLAEGRVRWRLTAGRR